MINSSCKCKEPVHWRFRHECWRAFMHWIMWGAVYTIVDENKRGKWWKANRTVTEIGSLELGSVVAGWNQRALGQNHVCRDLLARMSLLFASAASSLYLRRRARVIKTNRKKEEEQKSNNNNNERTMAFITIAITRGPGRLNPQRFIFPFLFLYFFVVIFYLLSRIRRNR